MAALLSGGVAWYTVGLIALKCNMKLYLMDFSVLVNTTWCAAGGLSHKYCLVDSPVTEGFEFS